jgi:hypothetical protein
MAPRLKDAFAFLDRLHHRLPVSHRVRHGLLAVNILARGHGVQRYAPVQMVGHGNQHRVHGLVVEKSAVIAAGRELRAVGLPRSLVPRRVKVGSAHAHAAWHQPRRAQQVAAANPGAHNRKANPPRAGINLGSQLCRFEQCCFDRRASRGCARAHTHKVAPRNSEWIEGGIQVEISRDLPLVGHSRSPGGPVSTVRL